MTALGGCVHGATDQNTAADVNTTTQRFNATSAMALIQGGNVVSKITNKDLIQDCENLLRYSFPISCTDAKALLEYVKECQEVLRYYANIEIYAKDRGVDPLVLSDGGLRARALAFRVLVSEPLPPKKKYKVNFFTADNVLWATTSFEEIGLTVNEVQHRCQHVIEHSHYLKTYRIEGE